MKKIALFLALLLLLVFGYMIVFLNFLDFSFSWDDLLIYSIVGIIIYFLIRTVGKSLNKKFEKSVNSFLNNETQSLFNDKNLLRTFGFLLITLLPFLLYIFAVALFAAIDFGIYGLLGVSYLPRIPIAIIIGIAIVVIGTGLAVLIGIYHLFFPSKRKTLGIEIKTEDEKKLWKLLDEVAQELNAKKINKIIVTPSTGIGVYLDGSIFLTIFGGGKRVLEIGLPSLHNLEISEFKAILAHEYGHFSNKDTQWTPFTYAMGNSLINTFRATPGPSTKSNEEGDWVRGVVSLNPAYWLLLLYIKLYFGITSGFSRIREVMADVYSMELYGGRAFSDGLLKVATNDTIFSEIVEGKYLPDLLKEGKTITNFSVFMDLVYDSLDPKNTNDLKNNILEAGKSIGEFDSHPALKDRISYAKKFDSKESNNKEPVFTLFENWEEINKKVAELYNYRVITYIQSLQNQKK